MNETQVYYYYTSSTKKDIEIFSIFFKNFYRDFPLSLVLEYRKWCLRTCIHVTCTCKQHNIVNKMKLASM